MTVWCLPIWKMFTRHPGPSLKFHDEHWTVRIKLTSDTTEFVFFLRESRWGEVGRGGGRWGWGEEGPLACKVILPGVINKNCNEKRHLNAFLRQKLWLNHGSLQEVPIHHHLYFLWHVILIIPLLKYPEKYWMTLTVVTSD